MPTKVPLWLAVNLKKQHKCRVQAPEWLCVGELTAMMEYKERPTPVAHFTSQSVVCACLRSGRRIFQDSLTQDHLSISSQASWCPWGLPQNIKKKNNKKKKLNKNKYVGVASNRQFKLYAEVVTASPLFLHWPGFGDGRFNSHMLSWPGRIKDGL